MQANWMTSMFPVFIPISLKQSFLRLLINSKQDFLWPLISSKPYFLWLYLSVRNKISFDYLPVREWSNHDASRSVTSHHYYDDRSVHQIQNPRAAGKGRRGKGGGVLVDLMGAWRSSGFCRIWVQTCQTRKGQPIHYGKHTPIRCSQAIQPLKYYIAQKTTKKYPIHHIYIYMYIFIQH